VGYRRIHGELAALGIKVAASTVWEMLKEHGIPPAPERDGTTRAEFLRSRADVLLACDLFETRTMNGARLYAFAVIEHATTHPDPRRHRAPHRGLARAARTQPRWHRPHRTAAPSHAMWCAALQGAQEAARPRCPGASDCTNEGPATVCSTIEDAQPFTGPPSKDKRPTDQGRRTR